MALRDAVSRFMTNIRESNREYEFSLESDWFNSYFPYHTWRALVNQTEIMNFSQVRLIQLTFPYPICRTLVIQTENMNFLSSQIDSTYFSYPTFMRKIILLELTGIPQECLCMTEATMVRYAQIQPSFACAQYIEQPAHFAEPTISLY